MIILCVASPQEIKKKEIYLNDHQLNYKLMTIPLDLTLAVRRKTRTSNKTKETKGPNFKSKIDDTNRTFSDIVRWTLINNVSVFQMDSVIGKRDERILNYVRNQSDANGIASKLNSLIRKMLGGSTSFDIFVELRKEEETVKSSDIKKIEYKKLIFKQTKKQLSITKS